MRLARRIASLPLRKLRPAIELEAEAQECSAELECLRAQAKRGGRASLQRRSTQANWHADMAKLFEGKSNVDWEIQCIRIGPVALLSTRGEPFTEISRQVVAGSPFPHTLVSGYSNGAFGYVPTKQACQEGGHEIEASPFSPDAAETLVNESLRLLREMA